MAEPQKRRGRDSAANILRILKATMKNTQKLTDDQELYIKKVLTQLEEGGLPNGSIKRPARNLPRPIQRDAHRFEKSILSRR
jgi:hypothetical protein